MNLLTMKPVKNLTNGVKYIPPSVKNDVREGCAGMKYHKSEGTIISYGKYPEYYTEIVSKKFVEGTPERIVKYPNFEQRIPAVAPHWENTYKFKPHYLIDTLFSQGRGSGTRAVQKVVKESLSDKDTMGRVMLNAECIDGHSYPAGFYYKLGFRFQNEARNNELEKWLKNGGNRKYAPTMTGMMYLPKENIEHCLNYKCE